MAGRRLSGPLRATQHLSGGMAGTRRQPAARAGPENYAERGRLRAARTDRCGNGARKTLFGSLARLIVRTSAPGNSGASGKLSRAAAIAAMLLATLPASALAATQISSTRVWPAQEYTRLTLESDAPIGYNVFTVGTPARLVLDLVDVEFNATLEQLPAKISPADPYVNGVRIGRFKPGVVRLVLDLKAQVKPQVFVLKPVGEYGHGLVLDVYPLQESDPVMALLDKRDAPTPVAPSAENTDKPATGFSGAPVPAPGARSRKAAPAADVARLI